MRKVIFDIGAHTGRDTEFYLKKGFDVVAVEANPYVCEKLEKRLKGYIQDGRLCVMNYALIDNPYKTKTKFIIHKNHDDWGTIYQKWNECFSKDVEIIEVDAMQPQALYNMHGIPYYMKIDIEGADIICLKQIAFKKPEYISAELLTPNNIHGGNPLAIINELLELGYTKFQLVNQGDLRFTKCPNPPLEGIYVDYQFDSLCSGLFGKELPDVWGPVEDVIMPYLHFFYNKPNCCGETFLQDAWFDIHATY
jgi:FkbM family methyltransferase